MILLQYETFDIQTFWTVINMHQLHLMSLLLSLAIMSLKMRSTQSYVIFVDLTIEISSF